MEKITDTEFQERVSVLMFNYGMSYSYAVSFVEEDIKEAEAIGQKFTCTIQELKDSIRKVNMAQRAERIGNERTR